MKQAKFEMRSKARTIKGLVNVLQSDAEYVYTDVEDYDIVSLGESMREMKDTMQYLIDSITELEYALYLAKAKE